MLAKNLETTIIYLPTLNRLYCICFDFKNESRLINHNCESCQLCVITKKITNFTGNPEDISSTGKII